MTKRLIEIDDAKLDAVRVALGTTTMRATVDRALDEVLAAAAQREQERALDVVGALDVLGRAQLGDRDDAWR